MNDIMVVREHHNEYFHTSYPVECGIIDPQQYGPSCQRSGLFACSDSANDKDKGLAHRRGTVVEGHLQAHLVGQP